MVFLCPQYFVFINHLKMNNIHLQVAPLATISINNGYWYNYATATPAFLSFHCRSPLNSFFSTTIFMAFLQLPLPRYVVAFYKISWFLKHSLRIIADAQPFWGVYSCGKPSGKFDGIREFG